VVALALALANAGSSMPANMAIMAITTNNSIKVNPRRPEMREVFILIIRLLMIQNEIAIMTVRYSCGGCVQKERSTPRT
jgi:hypothetical protein